MLPSVLLPRTETVHDIDSATQFMLETAAELSRLGLRASEFCFIVHRFIVSKACALAFSRPGNSRVRIDSTWGLPDGLLCYPHDSFEVDARNSTSVKRRIRCKSEYLDIEENGEWKEKRCGRPFDWQVSLEDNELLEIATYNSKLSEHLQLPVAVMYFVGIDPKTGHPSCLPWWYSTDEFKSEIDTDISGTWYTGRRIVVTDEQDLETLEQKLPTKSTPGTLSIRFKPKPDLLRSPEFIPKVAELAAKLDIPVELEGSILSHAFYVLSRHGVKVKCVDIFEPKVEVQRFHKLVRDLIPVKIQSHGEIAQYRKVPVEQLIPLLKTKAVEEALELYWEESRGGSFEELADVLEVVQSICRLYGREFDELQAAAQLKREERGGFSEGIVLEETREVPLIRREPSSLRLFEEDAS
ncbi:MAG TPA: nucleoside triphosphate pyrophosphohydrolase, partial [Nitrososphaera sp.]|nr:nucleoside triphosphate pyrophosphohydrolase [Nitrososphaera sp.]